MRLTLHSDYAVRILIHLGLVSDRLVTMDEISRAYGISKNHLMKISHKLANRGYLVSVRGRYGGVKLARDPKDINVGELLRWTEDNSQHVECFDDDTNQCPIAPACGLSTVLREALDAYFLVLDKYSLSDLITSRDRLKSLLALS